MGSLFERHREAPALIPEPASLTLGSGHFTVSAATQIVYAGGDSDSAFVANYLSTLVSRSRGFALQTRAGNADAAGGGAIVIRRLADLNATGKEGYTLDVTADGIVISASQRAGLFYGAITLWQLLTETAGPSPSVDVADMHIQDAPRFAWRGLLLDSARHFQSPEFVKTLIDAMAREKLNVLQWHLTDDEGWRLEIKKYPRLTEVGAWRVPAGDAAQHDIDPATKKPRLYGGFYSQDEVREIVAYAAARNITIVPEIEMPGHALAAIVAYPKLASVKNPPKAVSSDWGVFPYLYNVDDSTFSFLDDVLTETMALFPSTYIHVGGDEAVKDQWQASPKIQAQMKKLGIANEDALQSWFIARVGKFLEAHGRKLIGWDEILEGGIPPDATITSWRGTEGGITAAKAGHDAVMSPAPVLYLDNRQAEGPDELPGRGHIVTLEDVYGYDPAPASLTAEQAKHIIGVQANIWTEHIRTDDRVAYAAFPRAAALAEIGWSPAASRNFASFAARMPVELARYDALALPHSTSAFDARVDVTPDPARAKVTIALSNQAKVGTLRYTINGLRPGADAPAYDAPFVHPLPLHLEAAAFDGPNLLGKPLSQDIDAPSVLRRDSHELKMCSISLILSLEGQRPLVGKRPVFLVDVMNPCWIWEKADLGGITDIAVSGAQLPFNFQIGKDIAKVAMHPPATPDGEFEVHLDSCDGPKIATLPLSPPGPDDVLTVVRGPLSSPGGVHDLCFFYTRAKLDPFWALHTVQLIAGGEPQ